MLLQRKYESRAASSKSPTGAALATRRLLLDAEQELRRDQDRLEGVAGSPRSGSSPSFAADSTSRDQSRQLVVRWRGGGRPGRRSRAGCRRPGGGRALRVLDGGAVGATGPADPLDGLGPDREGRLAEGQGDRVGRRVHDPRPGLGRSGAAASIARSAAVRYFSTRIGGHREDVADVVEAVADVVGREVVGRAEVEADQVADRVVVLGPIEPADRHAARVGVGGGAAGRPRHRARRRCGQFRRRRAAAGPRAA